MQSQKGPSASTGAARIYGKLDERCGILELTRETATLILRICRVEFT